MSRLQQTVTCAFRSYGAVSTTSKYCIPGGFIFAFRIYPVGWVSLMTCVNRLLSEATGRSMSLVLQLCSCISRCQSDGGGNFCFLLTRSRQCNTTFKTASGQQPTTAVTVARFAAESRRLSRRSRWQEQNRTALLRLKWGEKTISV